MFLAKVLIRMQAENPADTENNHSQNQTSNSIVTDKTDDITDKDDITNRTNDREPRTVDLLWLIKRMCIVASRESAKSSGPTLKRVCVVKLLAAVAVELGADDIGPYLPTIMRPILRAANDKTTHAGKWIFVF